MRRLQTSRLEVYFAASNTGSRVERATAESATMEWGVSTRGSSRQEADTMSLQGQFLDGSFDQAGQLRELRGSGGVEVQRHTAGQPAMTSASHDLLARIAPDGEWSTVDQSGEVRLKNATGDAQGDRARFDRAADSVTLTGSAVLTDASSQTRAQAMTFRQTARELRAEGNVSTTELAKSSASTETKSEPAHISSSRMVADTASGHAVYTGRARLWQGDSVIQGDSIDLDRSRRTLIATGNVIAVFPQSRPSQGPPPAGRASGVPSPPGFWRAEAARMVYEEDQHRARLEQGAHARSADGTLRADRIDLFLASQSERGSTKSVLDAGSALGPSLESQQVQRAQGFGNVRVESTGRIGTGERADYSASESKFILSGGHPKIIDEFGNSTAGRQLTFFFADDRIVVDSEEGSRTLTLHRVEK
jgi:lipopolysaccharide export system protein LptA